MYSPKQLSRTVAASTALAVMALGSTAVAADAALDPGKDKGQGGGHGKALGHEKQKDKQDKQDKQDKSDQGSPGKSGESKGQAGRPEQAPKAPKGPKGPAGVKGPQGDPAGNNGTVKITPYGEVDGIPQNTPHVGCVFDVEWYGFDEGADIISQVTFESWAPTAVPMTVNGPSTVFVGGDPASGAGTDSGFDGEATYTLAFDGEPHPQQGYHVKLTINTPGSQGADVKQKVFWVENCEEEKPPTTPETPPTTPETPPTTPETPPTTPDTPDTPEVEGEQETDAGVESPADVEVLGEQATSPEVSGEEGGQAVPGAVDAGLEGDDSVPARGLFAALIALLGAIVLSVGVVARRMAR